MNVFLQALRKRHLLVQFHRLNKIDDFISFTKTRSRAPKFYFFKLLKNRMQKIYIFFFGKFNVFIYLFCDFLYWKLMENRKTKTDDLGNSFLYKLMFVSTILVKNCGRSYISYSQSSIFQEKRKVFFATILTIYKIYNKQQ